MPLSTAAFECAFFQYEERIGDRPDIFICSKELEFHSIEVLHKTPKITADGFFISRMALIIDKNLGKNAWGIKKRGNAFTMIFDPDSLEQQ